MFAESRKLVGHGGVVRPIRSAMLKFENQEIYMLKSLICFTIVT